MKIEILRENLEKAVSIASKVSNRSLSLPVLGCILLTATENQTTLRATNLDVSIEITLKAKVLTGGVIAIPAHTFSQTISALTDQKLTLETSGNNLIINGERGTTSITLVDPTEFPTLSYVKESSQGSVTIPTRDLIVVFKSVLFSTSTSGVKPELSSVSLTLEKGELITAATDSFRLAEVRVPIKVKGSFGQILIPGRNIPDIIRAIEGDMEVEIRVSDHQCSFISSSGHITSRVVGGAFPDYQAIIPKDSVAKAICLKEDAVRAFRKVSIFTDTFSQVHVSLKPSEKKFIVRAVNASVGETVDSIPCTIEGEDIDINFNIHYIIDVLSAIATDSVVFSVAGAGKPMVITGPNAGFTYLVMPMNR